MSDNTRYNKVGKLQELDIHEGDVLVCVQSDSSGYKVGDEYCISVIKDGLCVTNGCGNYHTYTDSTFRIKQPESKQQTPIWNNKRPCDMTKDELKSFLCDRVDGVEMELLVHDGSWELSSKIVGGYDDYSVYRIKQSQEQLEQEQIKQELEKLNKQVEELNKRLKG